MKKTLAIAAFILLWFAASVAAQNARRPAKQPRTVTIGVVADGPWPGNDEIFPVIMQEIVDLTRGEFDVRFSLEKGGIADWTPTGINNALDRALGDQEVDIVLALGVLAANEVGRRARLPKPVLAPIVIDAVLQGLPLKNGRSGRKNFSYLTVPWSFDRDLKAFREITHFNNVVVLAGNVFLDAIPGLKDRILDSARRVGVSVTLIPVGDSTDQALAQIAPDTTAVYITPLLQLSNAEFDKLAAGLVARKLPSFSQLGRREVERGIMAGIRPDSNFTQLGRRLAINVQRILLGDDPSRFTVSLKLAEKLVINMATARAIEVWPSWVVLTEAELLNQARDQVARTVSLVGVIEQAIEGNVDLAAARQVLVAGNEEIRSARANLLPQVDLSSTARLIDANSAQDSRGAQPEFLWNGSLTVSQIVWSETALAALSAQKHLQRSRREEYQVTELDVVRTAAVAYLDVLRAKTLERIQQDNLKVTRQNLDLARTRLNVGTANRAEVYRWESQIANDRKSVIEASAGRNVAEIQLNRILGRPMEEPYLTEETAIDDPALLTGQKQLVRFLRDPWIFRVFRQFMIREAVGRAPELKQLDAAIAVQERVLTSSRRSHWSPTVAVQGSANQRIWRAGEGSDPNAMLPPEQQSNDASFTWSVGLSVSLPLFSGGATSAEIRKAEAELSQLRLQRRAVRDAVAQRIGSALHIVGSSYAGIHLSRQSAEAAAKNLEIVTEAYSQGALSIIDLIDAQNAALVSEQVAANAVYDFLIDWMDVQRAVGQFDVLMDKSARADFFRRANTYLSAARSSPAAGQPAATPATEPAETPAKGPRGQNRN
ncbi:MAG: TolC family protein [Proteobacteria bacterium]|nr:TolC family protein [Pseudomonadota bacterium]